MASRSRTRTIVEVVFSWEVGSLSEVLASLADPLAKLPHLKKLTLASIAIQDDDLRSLASLQQLEDLQLNCDLTGAGVAHLARLPRLTSLGFFCARSSPTRRDPDPRPAAAASGCGSPTRRASQTPDSSSCGLMPRLLEELTLRRPGHPRGARCPQGVSGTQEGLTHRAVRDPLHPRSASATAGRPSAVRGDELTVRLGVPLPPIRQREDSAAQDGGPMACS